MTDSDRRDNTYTIIRLRTQACLLGLVFAVGVVFGMSYAIILFGRG